MSHQKHPKADRPLIAASGTRGMMNQEPMPGDKNSLETSVFGEHPGKTRKAKADLWNSL